jgi:hypothetical protein
MRAPTAHSDYEPVLAYELDEGDLITRLGGDWDGFALRNDAPELVRALVEGQSLWAFVHDAETRMLLRAILARVRRGGGELRLPFRCDGPAMRRFMELRVNRTMHNALRMESVLQHEEERAPVRLLDATRLSRGEPLRICGWCKRMPLESGVWVEVEIAVQRLRLFDASVLPPLSHGICPDCAAAIESEIDLPSFSACA